MYKLLKPYDRISWEVPLVGDVVELMDVSAPEGAAREKELAEKLAVCDILQADVDITVDDALLAKAPSLKAVVCTSIGVDYVDLAAATRRGVMVANNPDFCILSVAEYAIGMLYALMRRIPEGVQAVSENRWQAREFLGGMELYGKTLGVLGFGKTGKEVARQAVGIGMRVHAYDPYMNEQAAKELGAHPMSMEEVLKTSDVVTIHVPLMPETRGLIGPAQFALMKQGAYLVNVARGGIVDEAALLQNLQNDRLAGAAIDVMGQEPPDPQNPLLNLKGKNFFITPHIAWSTQEASDRNSDFYAEQIKALAAGEIPMAVVNKEVLKK